MGWCGKIRGFFLVTAQLMAATCEWVIMQLVFAVPFLRTRARARLYKLAGFENTYFEEENMDFVRGFGMLRAMWQTLPRQMWWEKVQLGRAPLDCKLWDFVSRSECSLLKYCRPARPLVVNFGSCTWAPFMAKFAAFSKMVERFADVADFVIIYIAEAHASDAWVIHGNRFTIQTHRSLDERFAAAQQLYDQQVPCRLLVDNMDDNASLQYSARPERLYVISEGKVAFQGGRGPLLYSVAEVEKWLLEYRQKKL